MITLISICDYTTLPWLLFWWLLPFLLGLLLGYLIWASYKDRYETLLEENGRLHQQIGELEVQLKACKSSKKVLEGDILTLKGEILEIRETGSTPKSSIPSGISTSAKSASKTTSTIPFTKLSSENLQIVEGIGPKMESVLKEKGISNWSLLGAQNVSGLRAILDSYGAKYKIIDPLTWAEQASLADQGKWDALVQRQKELSSGKVEGAHLTDSKVEKMMIKLGLLKKYKKDDLKAIEGISPKIEGLLHAENIKSWAALASTSVERIQEILTAAGDRYKLADPGTWPTQAGYAANAEWQKLEEYQDFLKGGREA